MYHRRAEKQMTFFDFDQGFGFPIDQNNRWVELSRQIPWDEAEESYAKNFASQGSFETGNVALSFRIALGSLIIKEVLHQSDRGTVKAIQENPYLQYFLGVEKYTSEPLFDPSMMTHFRKRLDLESMKEINDLVIKFKKKLPTLLKTLPAFRRPRMYRMEALINLLTAFRAGCLKKRYATPFQKLRKLSQPA